MTFPKPLLRGKSICCVRTRRMHLAKPAGREVVARFDDKGIWAGVAELHGYQALLAAARRDYFDLIVTEDISRLWRNRAEFGPRT